MTVRLFQSNYDINNSYYFALVKVPFSKQLKMLLLMLNKSIELPNVCIQTIITKEISRLLKKIGSNKKIIYENLTEDERNLQTSLCELLMKYIQDDPKFVDDMCQLKMVNKVIFYYSIDNRLLPNAVRSTRNDWGRGNFNEEIARN